jgi:glycosyltransferase involved in cell wall biosynthesis
LGITLSSAELWFLAQSILNNSNATRDDLLTYFQALKVRPKPCKVVPLAHEFVEEVQARSYDAPSFLIGNNVSTRRVSANIYSAAHLPFALCVGTLESRKNNGTLVRAWDTIVKNFGPNAPRLVFAGKHGWMNEDFHHVLRATGNANGRIRVVERPADHELAFLYRKCMFSICISYYEGWGLPIGESLWFGKPVIASNTSSMPEVGGELVDYVNPYDETEVVASISRMIRDIPYRSSRTEKIRSTKLRTWNDFGDDLWTALIPKPARRKRLLMARKNSELSS